MQKLSSESNKVLKTIEVLGPIRPSELVETLNISQATLFKHLRRLNDYNLIEKEGGTPNVYYQLRENSELNYQPLQNDEVPIEQSYIYVSPSGKLIRGVNGFRIWCEKNKLNFESEKKQFLKLQRKINSKRRKNLVSGKESILSPKHKLHLDNIFFSDFYNIGHFGKTKLGQLVYLGKTSQNIALLNEVSSIIRQDIQYLIQKYQIKMVAFIPPTIDRKVQFMSVLAKNLALKQKAVSIRKISNQIKIPQKTLRKLEDRIINAQHTISVKPNQKIAGNVLIIDDATGSGATLNETAKKIRFLAKKKIKIIGYSVVGSYKGFDVISEV